MTDFTQDDLTGARFERVRLQGALFDRVDLGEAGFEDVNLGNATFHDINLTGVRFDSVNLTGAVIRGARVVDVTIDGDVRNLRVWGVDVVPLVDAELNRLYPERVKMRPANADGYREAWDLLEGMWAETFSRARALPAESLHESVGGEWSFIETQRHLVFATDAWVRRAFLGDPAPWDPLDLPHDEMPDIPGVPRDRAVRPSLDEVLALRADRMRTVRDVVAELTDEQLAGMTVPVTEPGYPASKSFEVSECLGAILTEEWHHHLYAERDLAALRAEA